MSYDSKNHGKGSVVLLALAALIVVAGVVMALIHFGGSDTSTQVEIDDPKPAEPVAKYSGMPVLDGVAWPASRFCVDDAPQSGDVQRALRYKEALLAELRIIASTWPRIRDDRATISHKEEYREHVIKVCAILNALKRLNCPDAVDAVRCFVFRNRGKDDAGYQPNDNFSPGVGMKTGFLADWKAPGARELLFEILDEFKIGHNYHTCYYDAVTTLTNVQDCREEVKRRLIEISLTVDTYMSGNQAAGSDVHILTLKKLREIDSAAWERVMFEYMHDTQRSISSRSIVLDRLRPDDKAQRFDYYWQYASDESITPEVRGKALYGLCGAISTYRDQPMDVQKTADIASAEELGKKLYSDERGLPILRQAGYGLWATAQPDVSKRGIYLYEGPPCDFGDTLSSLRIYRKHSPEVDQRVRNIREYTGLNFGWLEATDGDEMLAAALKWKEWYETNRERIRWNQEKYMYEVIPQKDQ